MKMNFVVIPVLAVAAAVAAQAQGQTNPSAKPPATASAAAPAPTAGSTAFPLKIGLINLRDAVAKTADGQKAVLDLEDKFATRKNALQRRQIDLQAKQDQLSRGGAAMSDAAKASLTRELENDSKVFKRDVEDLNTDAEEEQSKVFSTIWLKMHPVLQQFAQQNGYATILDVSSDQSPVLWASNTAFITDDIINLYNQAHPPAPSAAPKTAAPGPTAKPPVPPATKKQ